MYLHPLFTPLSQADRDALRDVTELLTYKRHQLVKAAGEPCQHVYCVATGLLRVARHSRESSEEVTTDFIQRSDFFLPPSWGEDVFVCPATTIAALPSVIYAAPVRHLRALCAKYPALPLGLLELEARRIGMLRTQLRRVTTSSATKIVERVLHELTQWAPAGRGGYDKRITQTIIASYSGISREMVNKTMKDMESRGLVTKDAQGIHVPASFASTDFNGLLYEQDLGAEAASPEPDEPMLDLPPLGRNVPQNP